MTMLLASSSEALRGRLTEKFRYRPTAVIDAKLPAGSDCLDEVPRLRAGLMMAEAVSTEPTNAEMEASFVRLFPS